MIVSSNFSIENLTEQIKEKLRELGLIVIKVEKASIHETKVKGKTYYYVKAHINREIVKFMELKNRGVIIVISAFIGSNKTDKNI